MLHRRSNLAILVSASLATAAAALGSDCDHDSTGLIPLTDLETGRYLGVFEGGLYPGGSNTAPAAHHAEGLARAASVEPLDTDGLPAPNGRYVLLSIGASNTAQEWCAPLGVSSCDPLTFMDRAATHPRVDHDALVICNGAKAGQSAESWRYPDAANFDRVRDEVLAPQGVTEAQVQVIWAAGANPNPEAGLPDPDAEAFVMTGVLADIVRTLRVRYPNLKLVFLSCAKYTGYATVDVYPEPFGYENAFAPKWTIEAQIDQMNGGSINPRTGDLDYTTVAPWLGWDSYQWADGLIPRGDGLTWECSDFRPDGYHTSLAGRAKVGAMLLDFFLESPYAAPWFTDPLAADLDKDGDVDFDDLLLLLSHYGPCPAPPTECPADLDGDGEVGFGDVLIVLSSWS